MSQYPAPAYGDLEPVRQEALDRLTDAFSKGGLSIDEYERRVSIMTALDAPAAIRDLVADLPAIAPPIQQSRKSRAPVRASSRFLNPAIVGAQAVSSMCIMGDRSMAGNWLTSDKVSSFTVMGSTRMDFRNTELPPGKVKVDVFTLMGDTRIVVPQDVPVRMSTGVFMGDTRISGDVNQQTTGAETWIEISGFVLMGDLRVTTA